MRKVLSTFFTEAKILLNDQDRRGLFKLVEGCRMMDSFVDVKAMTERILAKTQAGVKAVVKDVRNANKNTAPPNSKGKGGGSSVREV